MKNHVSLRARGPEGPSTNPEPRNVQSKPRRLIPGLVRELQKDRKNFVVIAVVLFLFVFNSWKFGANPPSPSSPPRKILVPRQRERLRRTIAPWNSRVLIRKVKLNPWSQPSLTCQLQESLNVLFLFVCFALNQFEPAILYLYSKY